MTKRYGYLRVSTSDQSHDRQTDGLLALCDELHVETVSAVNRDRPVYKALRRRLKAGDTLVVWSLDRAFRSIVDAVLEAERLLKEGVAFHIVNLHVDTATPEGMLVYQLVGAVAEYERKVLIKRTREGLASARRRGVRLGRPPKLTMEQLADARQRLTDPLVTVKSVATDLDVKPWSLTRALRRLSPVAEAALMTPINP
ncbi:recombinase family protein [Bosea caraganae]|uniref:Recombinase family protein n=1 Tax=Bosea caraganae TaxID=2763117 RepID=A0A370L113_9HYPH|nr:recombinase family protein [Bosea caraganae]RDJ21068.1 recombinase family protein [Bosea caraganae]RDJ28567.1 recombinase family protein [Bosea caraganae]